LEREADDEEGVRRRVRKYERAHASPSVRLKLYSADCLRALLERAVFEENRVESLLIQGDTAIEQTVFAIRSTPKSGGESSLFRGRTQVVYVYEIARQKTTEPGEAELGGTP
jgi:hypothetical protein